MRFGTALGLSIAAHAILAAGIVGIVKWNPGPKVIAQLDLSSVELSFAEEEREEAPAVPMPEVAPVQAEPLPTEAEPPPPDAPPLPDLPPKEEARPEPEPQTEAAPQAPQPPAPAPKQAKIDAPPAPKRTIKPDYPRGSRQRGEEGEVTLAIEVGADGLVKSASVVSSCGFPDLEEAALKAVRKARFTPARSGSKAVASTARLTIAFKLDK